MNNPEFVQSETTIDGDDTITYIAYTDLSHPNSDKLRIQKITENSTSTTIEYPDGNNSFNYTWADRTEYTYAILTNKSYGI